MPTYTALSPVRLWGAWLLRITRNTLLIGIPFALFFGLFQHHGYWQSVVICYGISVAIGFSVAVFTQGAEELYCRFFPHGQDARGRQLVLQMSLFGVTGVLGSQVPMVLLSRFGHIEMYGNWRGGMINVGFSVLFTTLFMGLIYARVFYMRMRENEPPRGDFVDAIMQGVIDFRDLIFFGSLIALWLFLTVVAVDAKRA